MMKNIGWYIGLLGAFALGMLVGGFITAKGFQKMVEAAKARGAQ